MAFSSGARINTNISAYNALNALNAVNRDLGVHQLRLATGKRINSASDDPSGYAISKKMEGRIGALSSALDNVGDAQSVYGVAEGAYQTVADMMVQIKQKQTRFNNGAMGTDEQNAITQEIKDLATEVDDIAQQTKFNGTQLLAGSYSKTFQVSEGATETFTVAFASITSSSLLGTAAGSITSANVGALTTDAALSTVNTELGKIGAAVNRLSTKESNLTTAITNTESAKSRILDTDIAKEQISSTKDQILQQTATSQLAQANSSPQVFLSLFR
jgi:flagellin